MPHDITILDLGRVLQTMMPSLGEELGVGGFALAGYGGSPRARSSVFVPGDIGRQLVPFHRYVGVKH